MDLPVHCFLHVCLTDVETACTQPSSWYPNAGWTGPDPEVYWSFDCVDSLVLMEGTAAVNAMVIPGKVIISYDIFTLLINI